MRAPRDQPPGLQRASNRSAQCSPHLSSRAIPDDEVVDPSKHMRKHKREYKNSDCSKHTSKERNRIAGKVVTEKGGIRTAFPRSAYDQPIRRKKQLHSQKHAQ